MPDSADHFFAQLPDGIRGPLTLETLRGLLEDGVLSEQSFIADHRDGPWLAIGSHEIKVQLLPEKRAFAFKPKEFEPINASPVPPAACSPDDCVSVEINPESGAVINEPPSAAIDAHEIVRATAATQVAHEKPMEIKKRPNRRLYDYILLIAVVDGIDGYYMYTLPHEPVAVLVPLSFMVLFTVSITWVIWFVMDRY